MKTVHASLADPIGDQVIEPVTIHVDQKQPYESGDDWQEQSRDRFRTDAAAIADALWASLPGGTLDQLVCEMLSRRATLFRVPMPAVTP